MRRGLLRLPTIERCQTLMMIVGTSNPRCGLHHTTLSQYMYYIYILIEFIKTGGKVRFFWLVCPYPSVEMLVPMVWCVASAIDDAAAAAALPSPYMSQNLCGMRQGMCGFRNPFNKKNGRGESADCELFNA